MLLLSAVWVRGVTSVADERIYPAGVNDGKGHAPGKRMCFVCVTSAAISQAFVAQLVERTTVRFTDTDSSKEFGTEVKQRRNRKVPRSRLGESASF